MLDKEANEDGFWTIKVSDRSGNSTLVSRPKDAINEIKIRQLTRNLENSWKIANFRAKKLYYSQLGAGNEWSEPVNFDNPTATSGFFGPYDINNNTFVRISSYVQYGESNEYASSYSYFYTGLSYQDYNGYSDVYGCWNDSSEKYDYIQKISDDTFLVTSDAVTLVHVLTTDKPYNECKDWTVDQWEAFNTPIGDKILTFDDTHSTAQLYRVPDGIPKGKCYVVIAQFSQSQKGTYTVYATTSTKSEVMIKK